MNLKRKRIYYKRKCFRVGRRSRKEGEERRILKILILTILRYININDY